MRSVPEFAKLVEAPELLTKLCMEVIEQIDDQNARSDLTEIEPQLREIAHAIDKLEQARTSVPDELRQLKTSLAAKLAVRDKIIERLKPLEEGLEKVLQDLRLRIGNTKAKSYRRPSNGSSTSREVIRREITRALELLGGAASAAEVRAEIERNIGHKLLPGDKISLYDGSLSWHEKCKKERARMITDGILKNDSPKGIWELTGKVK